MLIQACKNSSIAYEILHPNQNVVKVKFGDREYYFTNYSTPLTSQSVAYCDEKYLEYLEFSSIDKIITEIKKNFALPVILKRNRGSGGNNVFKCTDLLEVRNALDHIFNINSKNYDYVALVQEPIHIVKEYRSVCLNHEQIVLYEKDISQAKFTGNLSPLHWEGAIAKQIDDVHVMQAINQLIKPIFQKMAIAYVGLDIAFDNQGNYWLIEANSHPNFDIFIRDNGEEAIVQLFQKILEYLKTSSIFIKSFRVW